MKLSKEEMEATIKSLLHDIDDLRDRIQILKNDNMIKRKMYKTSEQIAYCVAVVAVIIATLICWP